MTTHNLPEPEGRRPPVPPAPPPRLNRPNDVEKAAWLAFIACLLAADDTAGAG